MKKQSYKYLIDTSVAEALRLTHGELAVYALIDSFTKGREGLYYGSQCRLSEGTGYSVSTVKRALSELMRLGYIERCESEGKRGYRSCRIEKEEDCLPPNDAEKWLPAPEIMEKYNIDVCELITRMRKSKPKYRFHSVGRRDRVCMTAEQFKNLLELVDCETLGGYILRLEGLIIDKGYRTHNPYETLRRWILKDVAVHRNR